MPLRNGREASRNSHVLQIEHIAKVFVYHSLGAAKDKGTGIPLLGCSRALLLSGGKVLMSRNFRLPDLGLLDGKAGFRREEP